MRLRETAIEVYRTAEDRDLTFMAAGFAYYAFVSLVPFVLLAIVAGSLVGGERVVERLLLVAGDYLPPAGQELLLEAMTTETGRAQATVLALLVAAWGALRVFRGLSLAFDRLYGAADRGSLLEQVRNGVVVVASGAGALALMVAVGAVIGFVTDEIPFVGVASWLALPLGLVLAFLPLYYVLPPVPVDPAEVLPGAVFAAVGWTVLQAGFQLYAVVAGRYAAYGAVGAVILFVTWLYFAGILLLLGAVLNVVLAGRVDAEVQRGRPPIRN